MMMRGAGMRGARGLAAGGGPDEDEKHALAMDKLQSNMKEADLARTFLAIVGGCMAGVIGATGLMGLFYFMLTNLITTVMLLARMGFQLQEYTRSSLVGFYMADVSKHALSFVLFWTASYALAYIY